MIDKFAAYPFVLVIFLTTRLRSCKNHLPIAMSQCISHNGRKILKWVNISKCEVGKSVSDNELSFHTRIKVLVRGRTVLNLVKMG